MSNETAIIRAECDIKMDWDAYSAYFSELGISSKEFGEMFENNRTYRGRTTVSTSSMPSDTSGWAVGTVWIVGAGSNTQTYFKAPDGSLVSGISR